MAEDDVVFKALADPTRRALLDRLRERNGQTLGELCEPLNMARQSATQHLGLLEAANLITTIRRGREKLHYLNPVPLWDIAERWIEKFERPRLRALSAIRRRAEEDTMAERPSYVYVTYIESTPERVWEALTDADLTARYWGHSNVSDWQAGSPWEHRRVDGSGIADVAGTVLESLPPRRLAMTFDAPGGPPPQGPSQVTFDIEPYHEIVRLTVTHENLADESALEAASAGWPAVLANLKSLLETGHELPRAPWEMHAELRAAQMARNDGTARLDVPPGRGQDRSMTEEELRAEVAHPARVYDYWLGGIDNFAADRAAAEQVMRFMPEILDTVRGNRRFLVRAVGFLRDAGIRQFIDIGSGLPSSPNVHDVAQARDTGARVVYVDNDPLVFSRAGALTAPDRVTVVQADLRDVDGVLARAGELLDLSQPAGLLFVGCLHHIVDADDPAGLVDRYLAALVPGSYLVISHVTSDRSAEKMRANSEVAESSGAVLIPRGRDAVIRMFNGRELVEPGLVLVSYWRPEGGNPGPGADRAWAYGGVAAV